jgi:2'-5' RNA ligase
MDRPGNYHITLRFIGDIDEPTADSIADRLAQVKRPAFELELDGLGAFGSRKPHALYAAAKSVPALNELQAELERIVQRLGLEPERRKFTPHVTLARLKVPALGDVADYLALRAVFKTAPFPVGRFVLLSSRASRGGGPVRDGRGVSARGLKGNGAPCSGGGRKRGRVLPRGCGDRKWPRPRSVSSTCLSGGELRG